MNTRSQKNNRRMSTRSSTQPNATFYELPVKKNRKRTVVITTPPPTPPSTPSAPKKLPIAFSLTPIFVPQKLDGFVLDPDSSDEWMKNKRRKSNGQYAYMCGRPNPNTGKKCICDNHDSIGLYSGCARHYMWEEKMNKYLDF